jgi:hypothetical protein
MSPQANGFTKIHNDALSNDISRGTGSGLLAGSLWGLTCGPFVVLCVPLGAIAGTVTGAAAGAVVGVTGELSPDKAVLLRNRLIRIQQSHGLLAELQANVTDRAQKFWTLSSDQSSTVVAVELLDLQLTSTRDERIRVVVQVQVTVQAHTAKGTNKPQQRLYDYVGPFSSLATWLDESSDFVDTSLTSASQQIAAQIIADLAAN